MVFRLWHYLGIWLAAVMLAVPSAPVSAQRIVAVGDLHGDYDAWITIARGAGLIDARNRWAGGPATLVQLGDITDRGPDSLKIIRHLQKLQKEAIGAGGQVMLVGHSDIEGASTANRALALERALAARAAFEARGVFGMQVESAGEMCPVADTESAAGRRLNRRVEIWIRSARQGSSGSAR